jgi:hypothetical protein
VGDGTDISTHAVIAIRQNRRASGLCVFNDPSTGKRSSLGPGPVPLEAKANVSLAMRQLTVPNRRYGSRVDGALEAKRQGSTRSGVFIPFLANIAHRTRDRSKIGLIRHTRENQGDKERRNHERRNEPARSFVVCTPLILAAGKSLRKSVGLDFSRVAHHTHVGVTRKNCELNLRAAAPGHGYLKRAPPYDFDSHSQKNRLRWLRGLNRAPTGGRKSVPMFTTDQSRPIDCERMHTRQRKYRDSHAGLGEEWQP